jgi:hypothetical protein
MMMFAVLFDYIRIIETTVSIFRQSLSFPTINTLGSCKDQTDRSVFPFYSEDELSSKRRHVCGIQVTQDIFFVVQKVLEE